MAESLGQIRIGDGRLEWHNAPPLTLDWDGSGAAVRARVLRECCEEILSALQRDDPGEATAFGMQMAKLLDVHPEGSWWAAQAEVPIRQILSM